MFLLSNDSKQHVVQQPIRLSDSQSFDTPAFLLDFQKKVVFSTLIILHWRKVIGTLCRIKKNPYHYIIFKRSQQHSTKTLKTEIRKLNFWQIEHSS